MHQKIMEIMRQANRWHIGIALFLIVELNVIPKQQLGFECNDPALSHPFTGDTITWKWLLTTVCFLPLVVLLITERIYHKQDNSTQARNQALFWYKEYMFGMLINLIVVQTLKILVGAPRPHFFDTCNSPEASSCRGTEFVSSYTCSDAPWLSKSDTSFPSGHAALAVHTGVFIAYYLHKRTIHARSNIILALQVLSIVGAIFCAVSRITDRRHHWWDVLAGSIIGVPIVALTIYSFCENFVVCTDHANDRRTDNHNNIDPALSVSQPAKLKS